MRAYIAGPLFNEGERWWNAEIDLRVRNLGFETYIPQNDGVKLENKDDVPKIFESDKNALIHADVVVANLDGMDVDSGTLQHREQFAIESRDRFWRKSQGALMVGGSKFQAVIHEIEVKIESASAIRNGRGR